ncbi:Acylamino-acid-releasing enzyme [Hypsizygus marmoreus]|uniref:acylaminoacyl-peptidase n=1 Tax=Hypsizygus marmoreus TaxID=39966 RepID=A0A369JD49_HYPMA|nr:Acylamino-acid-releasing enzyme [Hypsizygus marmoreus]
MIRVSFSQPAPALRVLLGCMRVSGHRPDQTRIGRLPIRRIQTTSTHLHGDTMYKQLTEIPVPSAAQFVDTNVIQLTSTFHDHARNTKRSVTTSFAIAEKSITMSPQQDVGDAVSSALSPSRKFRAVLREVKDQSKTKRFVEVWNELEGGLETSLEVTDTHEFVASLSFSASESYLLYIAEGNLPSISDDPYQKFRFTPQFGEGIAGKRRPTIFVFTWDNAASVEVPRTPKLVSLSVSPSALFGQAIFSPNSNKVYATGYEYTPDHRILGVKGCFNRPSGIWEINLPSSLALVDIADDASSLECSASKLTPSNLSCRSPRIVSSNGKTSLLWLSCPSGGAHAATSLLYSLDITNPTSVEDIGVPLVDSVSKPDGNEFPGLYPDYNLPIVASLQPSDDFVSYVVTHSTWGSRNTVVLVSSSDGSVKDLTPDAGKLYSWKVLNTDGKSRIICARSTPTTPNELVLGQLNESEEVVWRVIHKPTLAAHVESALASLRSSILQIPGRFPTETIVIQSALASNDVPPCITTPHGGPHATTITSFSPSTVALALEGYTISQPNYTGSLGFGENAVRALLGNCGTLDVQDCIASTRYLIDIGISVEGPGKQFIMGGSHGGFLAAHLIGQFPDVFTAAVIRNPVISAGELSTTDIPDWYYAEFGLEYPVASSPSSVESPNPGKGTSAVSPPIMSPETFARIQRASPISHVNAVRAAVLLFVGSADLRVAPTQGIEYYHALKGRARNAQGDERYHGDVEMLIFEGESHPLDGVEASRVGWEAARDFLVKAGKHV